MLGDTRVNTRQAKASLSSAKQGTRVLVWIHSHLHNAALCCFWLAVLEPPLTVLAMPNRHGGVGMFSSGHSSGRELACHV